ncbi:dCMP deaminase [Gracilaria domingensis]|nr:dCMP deaminase [Gracilaria domingensis]
MLIFVCGPHCAGKKTLARYLTDTLGFLRVDQAPAPDTDEPKSDSPQLPSLVSSCWRQDTVGVIVCHPSQDKSLMNLLQRPWVLIVYVDGPVLARFHRFRQKLQYSKDWCSFLSFIEQEHSFSNIHYDSHYHLSAHSPREALNGVDMHQLYKLAHIRIFNDFDSVQLFHQALAQIDFTDMRRLRPTWDTYFMSLARLTAQRTNCMKRRVGCVIARDRRVVATGYNGTPAGVTNCFEGGCPRCNQQTVQGVGLDLCLCLHAEENAIIEAGRQRCQDSTLYTTVFPCILCSKKIVQAGVSRVAFQSEYGANNASESLLKAGGVIIEKIVADDVCARATSMARDGVHI